MGKEAKLKLAVKRRSTPVKKRGGPAYERKVIRIRKQYNHLLKCRETPADINPNTKVPARRKVLQPLDFYIGQVKKPSK